MTILHRTPPRVQPEPVRPGPALQAVGLVEAAEHYARAGTLAGCESVDPEDLDLLQSACDHDHDRGCDHGCPGEPRLPLADWIETQAAWFRSQETDAAAWLAGEMQELADLARALHAATIEQFDDRREALEHARDHESACFDSLPPIDLAEF